MKGVNSTMIYYKKFCKYHNVPPSATIILKQLCSSKEKQVINNKMIVSNADEYNEGSE
jgi:hypothetical protein